MYVFRIFVPNLSCQCFHSSSFTCCCNLAPIPHESLNWVLLFLMAAPETGNMMWRTGKWKDDKTSQQWHLWLICQRLCQQWKPGCHTLTNTHWSMWKGPIHMLQPGSNGMEQEASVNHCCCYTQSEAKGEFGQGVNSQGGDASVRTEVKE